MATVINNGNGENEAPGSQPATNSNKQKLFLGLGVILLLLVVWFYCSPNRWSAAAGGLINPPASAGTTVAGGSSLPAPVAPAGTAATPTQQQSPIPGATAVNGSVLVALATAPNHAEVGKVYSDPNGNTYQRDEGDRICNFAVNGNHVKTVAIENMPDKAASKAACDLEWLKFKDSMRPTTAVGAK